MTNYNLLCTAEVGKWKEVVFRFREHGLAQSNATGTPNLEDQFVNNRTILPC
jgi:hypothetical protein